MQPETDNHMNYYALAEQKKFLKPIFDRCFLEKMVHLGSFVIAQKQFHQVERLSTKEKLSFATVIQI